MSFDYGSLAGTERHLVEGYAREIKNFIRRSVRDEIATGRMLHKVKKILGHGRFIAWLEAEFGWSVDTAERRMKIADRFGDIPQNAEFALTALYTLAGNDTPDPARREAVERAAKGERITPTIAKAIKVRHAAPVAQFAPSEEGHTNEPLISDTPSAQEVTADGEAGLDSIEDRGSRSRSSARRKAQPPVRAQRPGAPSCTSETDDPRREPTSSISSEAASPDELAEAIDRLLALMPISTHPDWEEFVRNVRQLTAERRQTLIGKLTKLSDAAVNVRRHL